MHALPFHIGDVMVFLAAAGLVAPLLHRLRISPVLSFLLVGLAVGPYGLGALTDQFPWLRWITINHVEGATAFAELGVVLLLFIIGLEISVRHLWTIRRLVFGLGALQIAVCGAVIAGVASLFGNPMLVSAIIGLAFALSSTAIVLQLLSERGQIGSESGRTSFAILLMQDLAVVPILLFVSLAAARGDEPIWQAVGLALGVAVAVIGVIFLVGRATVGRFLRFAAGANAPELLTAAVLLVIVATAAATSAAGLSLALGAFLAGLILAETEFRHDVEVSLAPFKGLFLGLFFLSVGMGVDLGAALSNPMWLGLSVVGLVLLKGGLILILARAFGVRWPAAMESALMLGGAGEFAFVILGAALYQGLIAPDTAAFMTLTAGTSMAITPILAAGARRLAAAMEAHDARSGETAIAPLEGHVIVVGYGRVGRLVEETLAQERITAFALDTDPSLVAEARARGAAITFGDARKTDILERLGADRALAVAVTTDDPGAAEAVVAAVARTWPGLPVYARARDMEHARRLLALGATRVTPETLEASLDLTEAVLQAAGVSAEAARGLVDARRRSAVAALSRQPDPTFPSDEAESPDAQTPADADA